MQNLMQFLPDSALISCKMRIFAATDILREAMEADNVIESIKQVARTVLPTGSTLYLYGSRARGDFHEDSDWDLLILLDKFYFNVEEDKQVLYES